MPQCAYFGTFPSASINAFTTDKGKRQPFYHYSNSNNIVNNENNINCNSKKEDKEEKGFISEVKTF